MDHHQKWCDGAPLCRTCTKRGSKWNDPCAAIFMEALPARSVVIFADQCTMCSGLYDSPRGLDNTEITKPEGCGMHALPQGAEYRSKDDSDIAPPPIEERNVWQRPAFINGKLHFPDGQAAADAAVVALTASATATKLVTIATMCSMVTPPPVVKPSTTSLLL